MSRSTLISRKNMRLTAPMLLLRQCFSTGSTDRRVLCSLQELQHLQGKGLKFSMHAPEPKQAAQTARAKTRTTSRWRENVLTTGFVFLNEKTQQPRAFINRCPHALLELDFDDSDFFCEGFIHCKAHDAFFDPDTGICLQGPTSSRNSSLRGLDELRVAIDGEDIVLLPEQSNERFSSVSTCDNRELEAYKREKQHELVEALSKRLDLSEVEEMQQRLHVKTMARLKQYEEVDGFTRKMKK